MNSILIKLKALYTEFLLWRLSKEFIREATSNINISLAIDLPTIIHEDKEQKYFNGMSLLKQRLREELTGKSLVEQHSIMEKIGDNIFNYAYEATESKEKLTEILKSTQIFKGKDIKTEEDHKKMLDKRIESMYNVQKKKLERKLLREARQAYNSGNLTLHKTLMDEWKHTYG